MYFQTGQKAMSETSEKRSVRFRDGSLSRLLSYKRISTGFWRLSRSRNLAWRLCINISEQNHCWRFRPSKSVQNNNPASYSSWSRGNLLRVRIFRRHYEIFSQVRIVWSAFHSPQSIQSNRSLKARSKLQCNFRAGLKKGINQEKLN